MNRAGLVLVGLVAIAYLLVCPAQPLAQANQELEETFRQQPAAKGCPKDTTLLGVDTDHQFWIWKDFAIITSYLKPLPSAYLIKILKLLVCYVPCLALLIFFFSLKPLLPYLTLVGFISALIWIGSEVVGGTLKIVTKGTSAGRYARAARERVSRWISCLERIIYFIGIITGIWQVLVVMAALRAFIRFFRGEDNPAYGEYHLLGILLSFTFALLCGLAYIVLIHNFPDIFKINFLKCIIIDRTWN